MSFNGIKYRIKLSFLSLFSKDLPIPKKDYIYNKEAYFSKTPDWFLSKGNANIFELLNLNLKRFNYKKFYKLSRDFNTKEINNSEFDVMKLIGNLILNFKPKKIIEIGVYHGAVSIILAKTQLEYLNNNNVHLIDVSESNLLATKKNFKKFNIKMDGITFHNLNSNGIKNIQKQISNADFVFIDADHRYEGINKDFQSIKKLTKKNALIVLHDSHKWTGVKRVANKIFEDNSEVYTVATSHGSGITIIKNI